MIDEAIRHPIDIPSKERPPHGPLRLAPLLDAQAEIAAVRGDLDTLRRAAAELRLIVAQYPSSMLRAMSSLADARLCLGESDPAGAIAAARAAVAELELLGAPFEAAMARLVAADGHQLHGEAEHASQQRPFAQGEQVEQRGRQQRHDHQRQQPAAPEGADHGTTAMTERHSASSPAIHMVPPSSMKPRMRVPIGGGVVGGARGALRCWLTQP